MKQTAWADLPNAKHIDRILADLKRNPDRWAATRNAARNAASDAARSAARTAARTAARDDAWNAAWNAARTDARNAAASGAILALIAYDDCAYLLDEKPEHVQMLALLGNEKAILLYSACIALQKEII